MEQTVLKFILRERFITLTAIGSIFTFAFISSLKVDIIDPVLDFMLPEENFGFMDITIRDGEKMIMPPRKLEIKFGNFFRQFVTWLLVISTLFVIYKFTDFPDIKGGNSTGQAIPGVA
jgi:large-conductance mechanosensitive channel